MTTKQELEKALEAFDSLINTVGEYGEDLSGKGVLIRNKKGFYFLEDKDREVLRHVLTQALREAK